MFRDRSGAGLITILLGVFLGACLGLSVFTFGYARGASYVTDEAAACANCHVMRDHFTSWMKSSHRAAAVCNDCHTPDGLLPKYATKVQNGFFHSLAFTTGRFPDAIRIKQRSHEVAEGSCLKCHTAVVHGIQLVRPSAEKVHCILCHARVGHQ